MAGQDWTSVVMTSRSRHASAALVTGVQTWALPISDKRRAGHQAADWQDLSPPLQSHDMPHRRQDRARHLHRHRGEAPEFWLLCPAAHKTVKHNGPTLPGDGPATGASLSVPFPDDGDVQ